MSDAGPFRAVTSDGFEAWGYRFPSGKIVLEWIPETTPDEYERFDHAHQSIYYDMDDFRTASPGVSINWGETPDE